MPDRLYEALIYKAHDMHPIPFYPTVRHPPLKRGDIYQYRQRVPSVDELKRWFQGTDHNIGLITGVNGLHILDVDGDEGHQSLTRLPPFRRPRHSSLGVASSITSMAMKPTQQDRATARHRLFVE